MCIFFFSSRNIIISLPLPNLMPDWVTHFGFWIDNIVTKFINLHSEACQLIQIIHAHLVILFSSESLTFFYLILRVQTLTQWALCCVIIYKNLYMFAVTGKLWPKLYEIKLHPIRKQLKPGVIEQLCLRPPNDFLRQ